MTADLTDDGFFGGRLRLLQPARGHRIGADAALLAAAARSRLVEGAAVADFGAGVGAVGLALAQGGAGFCTLVEIDPDLTELGRENALRNGLGSSVEALCADVGGVARVGAAGPARDSLDLVAANPPFNAAARFRASPDQARARAHAAADDLVEVWTRAAARALKPGGVFVMIHRPEAIGEAVAAFARRFGDIRLRPVHARGDGPAIRILIAGAKGRRGPLVLLPAFVLHGPDGGFTAEADRVQRGEAPLSMT